MGVQPDQGAYEGSLPGPSNNKRKRKHQAPTDDTGAHSGAARRGEKDGIADIGDNDMTSNGLVAGVKKKAKKPNGPSTADSPAEKRLRRSACATLALSAFSLHRLFLTRLFSAQIPPKGSLFLPSCLRTRHHPEILPALEVPPRHPRLPRGTVRADRLHRQHISRPHPEAAHLRLPSRQGLEPV